jgi:thioredoxin:protein disulfide reductase
MKHRGTLTALAAMVLSAAFACVCFGQENLQVVEARAVLATNGVHAGSQAKAAVVGDVKPGFHINDHHPSLDYLIPTKLEFAPSKQFRIERVLYPKGRPLKFSFSDTPLSVYEGEVPIGVLLRISKSISPRTVSLRGKLTYQACNDHACYPPTSVPLSLTLRVLPSGVPLRPENAGVFSKIKFN